jgi:hypothetical protein
MSMTENDAVNLLDEIKCKTMIGERVSVGEQPNKSLDITFFLCDYTYWGWGKVVRTSMEAVALDRDRFDLKKSRL